METNKTKYVFGLLRMGMGWIFLWAFMDKLLGLGFSTLPVRAWTAGGSPTRGFLSSAPHGPLAEFFQSLAGVALVDWLFMLGILFAGLALLSGIFVRLGGTAGILILLLMYLAVGLPPENNPFLDDHIIYILVILGLVFSNAGDTLGFGKWWGQTAFVLKFRIFK